MSDRITQAPPRDHQREPRLTLIQRANFLSEIVPDTIFWSWPTFASERRDSAERLDFELPGHLELLEWLRTFPVEQRKTLCEFVSHRHERMKDKLPMLTGSIEKLGALPIVIALYLQFKNAHWPPHASWLEIFLIFALISGYWVSVMQIGVRLRLQLYETLLRKALT